MRSALIAVAALGIGAPASHAVTVTGLGSCTAPTPPYPNLERLTVPGTVKVGADGRPTGASTGVTIRNSTDPYKGSGVDLFMQVIDTATGKVVGGQGTFTLAGCARFLWSLREFDTQTTLPTVPMKLQRGKLYLVRASAGFIDWPGSDPFYAVNSVLKSPVAAFVTV